MATVLVGSQSNYTTGYIKWYCNQGVVNVNITGNSFEVKYPSFSMYVRTNLKGHDDTIVVGNTEEDYRFYSTTIYTTDVEDVNHLFQVNTGTSNPTVVRSCTWDKTISLNTSAYFNSTNKTTSVVDVPLIYVSNKYYGSYAVSSHYVSCKGNGWYPKDPSAQYTPDSGCWLDIDNYNVSTLAYAHLTLDAPPIFTSTNISYTPTTPYELNSTASITLNNLTSAAQYGGYITEIKFEIGPHVITRTYTETNQPSNTLSLSLPLNTVGTFVPTVTVTDSRNQKTTKTFDSITVRSYQSADILIQDINRISGFYKKTEDTEIVLGKNYYTRTGNGTTSSHQYTKVSSPSTSSISNYYEATNTVGLEEDEGTSVLIIANFNWLDTIVNLQEPIVSINETRYKTTWYLDSDLSTLVNWSDTTNFTSSKILYGYIDDMFDTEYSYSITVTPVDSHSSGIAKAYNLDRAFYTIDFFAGGHGIAFGQPATQEGFECNMPATFNQGIDIASGAKYKIGGTALAASDVGAISDVQLNGTSIKNGTIANILTSNLINIFYPVGSYYDTSDSSFDPNTSLGGTWTSEQIKDDEIVEQGTNGIWTYRKWKSGIAECWGRRDVTISVTLNYGGAYYGTDGVSFPTGLFSAEPTVSASRQGRAGAGLIHISPYAVSSSKIDYFITNTNASYPNAPLGISFEAKGLWKTYSAPTTKYRWHRTA